MEELEEEVGRIRSLYWDFDHEGDIEGLAETASRNSKFERLANLAQILGGVYQAKATRKQADATEGLEDWTRRLSIATTALALATVASVDLAVFRVLGCG